MLATLSLLYKVLTWTLRSSSVKTAGNEATLHLHVACKTWNMSSSIVHTNSNITAILLGITRLTSRSIPFILKWSRMNYVLITSNIWTAKTINKQTPMLTLSRGTTSIRSSIQRSIRNFMKTETIQFT